MADDTGDKDPADQTKGEEANKLNSVSSSTEAVFTDAQRTREDDDDDDVVITAERTLTNPSGIVSPSPSPSHQYQFTSPQHQQPPQYHQPSQFQYHQPTFDPYSAPIYPGVSVPPSGGLSAFSPGFPRPVYQYQLLQQAYHLPAPPPAEGYFPPVVQYSLPDLLPGPTPTLESPPHQLYSYQQPLPVHQPIYQTQGNTLTLPDQAGSPVQSFRFVEERIHPTPRRSAKKPPKRPQIDKAQVKNKDDRVKKVVKLSEAKGDLVVRRQSRRQMSMVETITGDESDLILFLVLHKIPQEVTMFEVHRCRGGPMPKNEQEQSRANLSIRHFLQQLAQEKGSEADAKQHISRMLERALSHGWGDIVLPRARELANTTSKEERKNAARERKALQTYRAQNGNENPHLPSSSSASAGGRSNRLAYMGLLREAEELDTAQTEHDGDEEVLKERLMEFWATGLIGGKALI